jgi:hypothetical protein
VQPVDDPTLPPRISLRPLMRNWTEANASKRDTYDGENVRGRGNLQVMQCALCVEHSTHCCIKLIFAIIQLFY